MKHAGGKDYTNNNRRIIVASRVHIDTGTTVIPSIPHASSIGQWQGGFASFAGSSQMVPPMHTEAGSSQFQGGFSGIPQVNMPMFSTGTNDQWQGAHTYNIALHLQGIYQMSINENTQPQGPSFLDIICVCYNFAFNVLLECTTPNNGWNMPAAHNPTENHVATVGGRPQHITD
uniref:Uncharacterized protein n=1 Tax=Oryza glumipatula TaxID=40148 RepID=A0A0E0BSG2_9ORYZ